MTAWAQSLIRISNYEVETLQKRLADINERRAAAEMKLAVLDAEAHHGDQAGRVRLALSGVQDHARIETLGAGDDAGRGPRVQAMRQRRADAADDGRP